MRFGVSGLAPLLVIVCALVSACTSPRGTLSSIAVDSGYERTDVRAGGFEHVVFTTNLERLRDTPRLHVYLEGDGQPWRHRHFVMPDPTPRRPLMLELMGDDPAPSAYVGRPCYNGKARDPGCNATLWTSQRYSEQVVAAMTEVVRELVARHGVSEVWLIGHSGGGTLAMLMAPRLDMVSHVVTVAGNLDVAAWVRHHDYSPLYGSLDPAREAVLDERIRQWHLLGGRDAVVPPRVVQAALRRQPEPTIALRWPTFSHGCCWSGLWVEILQAVAANEPARLSAERLH